MADGKLVPAQAKWTGLVEVGDVRIKASFEVFDSGGSWSFLFGKPLIWLFDTAHFYRRNIVEIGVSDPVNVRTLRNMHHEARVWSGGRNKVVHWVGEAAAYALGESGRINVESGRKVGMNDGTARVNLGTEMENQTIDSVDLNKPEGQKVELVSQNKPGVTFLAGRVYNRWKGWKGGARRGLMARKIRLMNVMKGKCAKLNGGTCAMPICVMGLSGSTADGAEVPGEAFTAGSTTAGSGMFTRRTDPFQAKRVAEILRLVKRGEDLSAIQDEAVTKLIKRYADIFALSINEVLPVKGAVHTLDIPAGASFSRKVHQKPLTPPQRVYLHEKIDEMLAAGVIKQCEPGQVKCVSGTTLAQKAHQGGGLTLEELQHRINDQCIANGLGAHFPMPDCCNPTPDDDSDSKEPKWRICQNFAEINKITKIAPMPQGNIQTK
ncbi:hypothetical protein C0991_003172 [Blastosporella zonata]|nr:hypothetical protein C0991_003172 [Blastosporella zonata]